MTTQTSLADLHSHTTASDGVLSPADLVARALDKGVQMLAITDHDTINGLAQAHAFNQQQPQPLKLINGVEISTRWNNFDIHIVGLNVDVQCQALQSFLNKQVQLRDERAQEIGVRLGKAGIEGAYEGAKGFANGAAISRGHYARWLAQMGYAKDMPSVFKRYLARGKTGYVPNNWQDMATACDIIHQAGGLAVLAHPSGYKLSAKWLKKLVREFAQSNGDAMEVVLGQQSIDDRNQLISLSIQNQLLGSIGSDFHFPSNWIELGKNLFQPPGVKWVWESQSWMER
ncbi:PHP domain-containing protein [Shewanella intestini]|uniref:PHP domain-containing protein n=1 Tax=Shewanella intestini TaxID=2017544 RepID=A0ABS5I0U0_9GAMM|nr:MULTISPECIES: PHP domain-containing protein [Shewanella]MBR9726935.1 PHP domain-containing protein [Shewanella intestini]MRG34499.1 PHP domain-containing protein [Shewanella sp. XMDDZSB0408]